MKAAFPWSSYRGRSPAGVLGSEHPSESLFCSLVLSLLLRNRISTWHWTPTPFHPWRSTPLLLRLAQERLLWAASPTGGGSPPREGLLLLFLQAPALNRLLVSLPQGSPPKGLAP